MNRNLRSRFPIFHRYPDLVYLDSAATAHKPQEVIDALAQFYAEEYATVHRAIYRRSLSATDKYNQTRETVRKFLRAERIEEIVFTRGTTDAINLVSSSWGRTHLRPGDEILVLETEHHSNLVPWQMIAQERGALVRPIPVLDSGLIDLEAYTALLNRRTKLVAIAHISNVTGVVQPIRTVSDLAHKTGALLLVDGAQAAPHHPIDVQALDADFYAFSAHKCYGPTGVGVLYGKFSLLQQMPPLQGGGDMVERVDWSGTTYQEPPLKFEAGTPLIGSVIALKPALDFLLEIGLEEIAAAEKRLYDRALIQIQDIEGFRLIGSAPEKGALLTFSIDSIHPLDIATFLDLDQIAIRSGHLCAQPALRRFGLEVAARASFGIYNTAEDADRFAETLKRITTKLRHETRPTSLSLQ